MSGSRGGGGGPRLPPTWDGESTAVIQQPSFEDTAHDATPHDQTPPGGVPAEIIERPPIEVEVRKISSANVLAKRTQCAYEIWTKNRVYSLDVGLSCIEVIDLASGQTEAKHPFLGASLVGGQARTQAGTELTFPLPTPGAEAVFQAIDAQQRIRLSITSRVTRVILHVQRVQVGTEQRDSTWDQIASSRGTTLKSS
jgi:hypothetical protein